MMYDYILDFLFLLTLGGSALGTLRVLKHKSFHDAFNICAGFGGGKGGDGGGYSPPAPPDPYATAAAQGQQDRITARTNALLLNPAINSPFGSISYDTNSYAIPNVTSGGGGVGGGGGSGMFTTKGGGGGSDDTVTRPVQTIALSPDQQTQLNLRNNVMNTLGNLGVNWANAFSNSQSPQYNMSNIPTNIDYRSVIPVPNMDDYQAQADQASKAYYNQAYNLMQPAIQQEQRQLQDQLVNSGNPMDSESYNTQMGNFQRNLNTNLASLANQSVLQGYGIQNQLFNNANLTRQNQIQAAQLPYQTQSALAADQFNREQAQTNQNINSLSALLQGSQAIQNPTLPTGAPYNQSALQSPNIMGMIQANYQNQLNGYNQMYAQQQAQNFQSGNALTSGLFSLGSSLAGALF